MVEVDAQILVGVAITVLLALMFFGVVVLWDVALALRGVADKVDKLEDTLDDDLKDIGHSLDGVPGGAGGTQVHLSGGGTISPGAPPQNHANPTSASQPAGLGAQRTTTASASGARGAAEPAGADAADRARGSTEPEAPSARPRSEIGADPTPVSSPARASSAAEGADADGATDEGPAVESVADEEPDAGPAAPESPPSDVESADAAGATTDEPHPRAAASRGRFVTSPDVTAWHAMGLDREAIAEARNPIAGELEAGDVGRGDGTADDPDGDGTEAAESTPEPIAVGPAGAAPDPTEGAPDDEDEQPIVAGGEVRTEQSDGTNRTDSAPDSGEPDEDVRVDVEEFLEEVSDDDASTDDEVSDDDASEDGASDDDDASADSDGPEDDALTADSSAAGAADAADATADAEAGGATEPGGDGSTEPGDEGAVDGEETAVERQPDAADDVDLNERDAEGDGVGDGDAGKDDAGEGGADDDDAGEGGADDDDADGRTDAASVEPEAEDDQSTDADSEAEDDQSTDADPEAEDDQSTDVDSEAEDGPVDDWPEEADGAVAFSIEEFATRTVEEPELTVDEAVETVNDEDPTLSHSAHGLTARAETDEDGVVLVYEFDPEDVGATDSTRRLLRYQLGSVADRVDGDVEVTVGDARVVVEIPDADGADVSRWRDATVAAIDRTLFLSDNSE